MITDDACFDDLKIIILGSEQSGKSSIISAFLFGEQLLPKKPFIFASYSKEVELNKTRYQLRLCDTSGSNEIATLQRMGFLDCNIIGICVDGTNINWPRRAELFLEEAKKAIVPVVVLITKMDIRKVNKEELEQFKKRNPNIPTMEVNAKDQRCVKKVLNKMIEIAVNETPSPKGWCCC